MEFDTYAREHSRALLRLAAVLTNDNGLAEDIVQNVLIKVHARWDRIGTLDNTDAYVRRMLVNELSSWRRKWARYVPHPDAALDRRVEHPSGQLDDRAELVAELAKLPGRQRAAVTLRYLEDLSDVDIAKILGCRESTVRGYVHRALKTLRVEMSPSAAAAPRPNALYGKEA